MARVALTYEQKINQQRRTVSKYCKKLMRMNQIRQCDLADKTGLTQSAISYQLNGNVSLKLLIAIASMSREGVEELTKIIQVKE